MNTILQALLPIFLLLCVGALLKITQNTNSSRLKRVWTKVRHTEDQWSSVLNTYALVIALPALIIHSLAQSKARESISAESIIISSVIVIVSIIIIFSIVRVLNLKKEVANAYIICGIFGNVAFVGPPFILALLPQTAPMLSILIAIHVIIAFTFGIYILEMSKHGYCGFHCLANRVIKSPLIISVILGLFFLFFNIQLPQSILRALEMLGASASPVVLIAIGLFIAKKITWDSVMLHALIISGLKLLGLPILFILVDVFFPLRFEDTYAMATLLAAMPVAVTIFSLTEIYPIEKKIVAKSIIFSTLLSLITLPLVSIIVL